MVLADMAESGVVDGTKKTQDDDEYRLRKASSRDRGDAAAARQ